MVGEELYKNIDRNTFLDGSWYFGSFEVIMMELSNEDGAFLVRLARRAVKTHLMDGEIIHPPVEVSQRLKEKAGVFVTINEWTSDGKKLRGCIGFPRPDKPLIEAVISSAISAAVRDPRFFPMEIDELDGVVFEVSILTKPVLIEVASPLEYPKRIRIGRDGLIVEKGYMSGLLLPQVPFEYGWAPEEYLTHLCYKAGLPPDAWLSKEVNIYSFTSIIFEEREPMGEVSEKVLS